jgi:putative transposase
MRIQEIAQVRVRYGYRKIRVLLNREGWKVGKYLVERIYREEGLTLQQRRKRRRRVAEHRRERFHPTGPNQVWSMDFVADQLADGRRFRSLTVVDIYTRECLAIESEQRLKGEDVVRELNRIKMSRGVPKMVHCDNVLTTECYKEVRAKISCASDSRRGCSLNPSGFHKQQKWHSTIATQGPLDFRGLFCT